MQILKKINFLLKINCIKTFYYSLTFKSKIIIGYGCNLNIKGKGKIKVNNGILYIGMGISKPEKTVIDIFENALLNINGTVKIHNGCKIVATKNAVIEINDGTFINESSRIYCKKNIIIGSNCAISWNVNILDSDIHVILKNDEITNFDKPVIIQDNVWIGLNATILKGVTIKSNTVIAASSLIIKDCDLNSIYAGVPGKKVDSRINWKK